MENKKSKRKKMLPSQSVTVNTLNNFPDDILTHILSFLPCKHAFRTIVLSKRWVSLCHSLSSLKIDDKGVNNSKDLIYFRRFMDKVMLSPRAQSITLKSLDLRCWSQLWEDEPDDWLEAAKRRGVENLTLVLFNVPLAPSIFCCKTLMHLHLTRIRVGSMLHCSVDLPLLETLIMSQISFKDTEDFMKLLFGCPKLEYLNKHGIKANGTIVEANAGVPDGGYFKHLSKLTRARISLFNVPFTAVYNVKFLSIWIARSLSNKQINTFEKSLPVLENLRELQLTWFERIHNWEVVVKMLQNCPKLQTLTILKAENSASIEHWEYPDHVPECVSSHLTKFEVMHYEACEADFRFATYILQNARLLQDMTICHTLHPNPMESPQFLENLSSCPRISPSCKLSLFESQ